MSACFNCNLSPEEQDRVLAGWDDELTEEEQERLEALFPKHLFYKSVTRSTRACYCEACSHSFEITRSSAPAIWDAGHGNPVRCPRCGETVELICEGRMKSGKKLKAEYCAMIVRKDPDGALRLMAGVATRSYTKETLFDGWSDIVHVELQPVLSFCSYRLYYFSPTARQCWRRSAWNYFGERIVDSGYAAMPSIRQAFTPGTTYGWNYGIFDSECNIIGWENVLESWAKYSQALEWTYRGAEPQDRERVFGLEQYLAAYMEFPQLEYAMKLGDPELVDDLVIRRIKNHRAVNWRAKDPAAFYRMDRQRFKAYRAAGGTGKELILARGLGLTPEVVMQASAAVGRSNVETLRDCAAIAEVDILRGARYIQKHRDMQDGRLADWRDYLRMAQQLSYDLRDTEVSMPKQLLQAHDRASEIILCETDDQVLKRYTSKRRPALRKKYEMEYEGMCIRVPESAADIVHEGRNLEHCVGGYAKRHLVGKTTILFLRRAEEPEASLVTIEMEPDGKTIRQIHGWHNERKKIDGKFPPSPRETYAEFLSVWLKWLQEGSPRTGSGAPILKIHKRPEEKTA